ncbi:hypothetical protein JCM14450A_22800 [Geobacillus stearothermophilus]
MIITFVNDVHIYFIVNTEDYERMFMEGGDGDGHRGCFREGSNELEEYIQPVVLVES